MQEGGDGPLLVEPVLGSEIKHVDAAQLAIGASRTDRSIADSNLHRPIAAAL